MLSSQLVSMFLKHDLDFNLVFVCKLSWIGGESSKLPIVMGDMILLFYMKWIRVSLAAPSSIFLMPDVFMRPLTRHSPMFWVCPICLFKIATMAFAGSYSMDVKADWSSVEQECHNVSVSSVKGHQKHFHQQQLLTACQILLQALCSGRLTLWKVLMALICDDF